MPSPPPGASVDPKVQRATCPKTKDASPPPASPSVPKRPEPWALVSLPCDTRRWQNEQARVGSSASGAAAAWLARKPLRGRQITRGPCPVNGQGPRLDPEAGVP